MQVGLRFLDRRLELGRFVNEIEHQLQLNIVVELDHAARTALAQLERLPDPLQPRLVLRAQRCELFSDAGEYQTILSARGGDVKQAHAFKLFAPRVSLLEVAERATGDEIAAAVRHFQSQAVVPIEQEPVVSRETRESLQIGNDDDREFETLRLVNRHQSNRICCLINLPFTLATPYSFKLLHVAHEVANQMCARTLETGSECEELFHVRES